MSWVVTAVAGDAATLHGRELDWTRPTICRMDVTAPALVLGSTQRDEVVDRTAAAAAGVAVARRRSGGGAVLLVPTESLWVDVWLPADDPLWVADVGRSFRWIGSAWAAALHDVGLSGAVTHGVVSCRTPVGRLVCFAGLGNGEVTVDGRKAVGLAQRRTRGYARFQCVVHRAWRPDVYRRLLAPGLGSAGPADPIGEIRVATLDHVELTAAFDAFVARLVDLR
jgi:lipoate---protein ligase